MGTKTELPGMSSYEDQRVDTTFLDDFRIADRFGKSAVEDTYNRAFSEWKTDHRYMTELVLALNHLLWGHYYAGHIGLAKLYDGLWKRTDHWCMKISRANSLDSTLP